MMNPYADKDYSQWLNITKDLIENHPLNQIIVDACLKSRESILNGKINSYLNLYIKDMNISPQATGALLHDIIPEYITKNIEGFRKGLGKKEKDIVCDYDDGLSLEIKTSSQKSIYANRSYAKSDAGKSKSGYYLSINFEKISGNNPKILSIKMGWLDHSDWKAQTSETGQQASLSKQAREAKFITLYEYNGE